MFKILTALLLAAQLPKVSPQAPLNGTEVNSSQNSFQNGIENTPFIPDLRLDPLGRVSEPLSSFDPSLLKNIQWIEDLGNQHLEQLRDVSFDAENRVIVTGLESENRVIQAGLEAEERVIETGLGVADQLKQAGAVERDELAGVGDAAKKQLMDASASSRDGILSVVQTSQFDLKETTQDQIQAVKGASESGMNQITSSVQAGRRDLQETSQKSILEIRDNTYVGTDHLRDLTRKSVRQIEDSAQKGENQIFDVTRSKLSEVKGVVDQGSQDVRGLSESEKVALSRLSKQEYLRIASQISADNESRVKWSEQADRHQKLIAEFEKRQHEVLNRKSLPPSSEKSETRKKPEAPLIDVPLLAVAGAAAAYEYKSGGAISSAVQQLAVQAELAAPSVMANAKNAAAGGTGLVSGFLTGARKRIVDIKEGTQKLQGSVTEARESLQLIKPAAYAVMGATVLYFSLKYASEFFDWTQSESHPFLIELGAPGVGNSFRKALGRPKIVSQNLPLSSEVQSLMATYVGHLTKQVGPRKKYLKTLPSLLIHGPSGTGKLEIVKNMALSAKMDLAYIRKSDFVGLADDEIAGIFRFLKAVKNRKRLMIFIDRIDEFYDGSPFSEGAIAALDGLITKARVKKSGVAIVATAQSIESIPESRIKEFTFELPVSLPDLEERTRLYGKWIEEIIAPALLESEVSLDEELYRRLAVLSAGLSPQQIRTVVAETLRAARGLEQLALSEGLFRQTIEDVRFVQEKKEKRELVAST